LKFQNVQLYDEENGKTVEQNKILKFNEPKLPEPEYVSLQQLLIFFGESHLDLMSAVDFP